MKRETQGALPVYTPENQADAAENLQKNAIEAVQRFLAEDSYLVSLVRGDGNIRYTCTVNGEPCQFIISVRVAAVERKPEVQG